MPKADPLDAASMIALKEVFSLKAVRIILQYIDQLKKLYVDKLHQNFNNIKKAVGWQEVEDGNLPMISRSFLKLCKHHHLIPNLFNIEAL